MFGLQRRGVKAVVLEPTPAAGKPSVFDPVMRPGWSRVLPTA